jgi:hypothetical protein
VHWTREYLQRIAAVTGRIGLFAGLSCGPTSRTDLRSPEPRDTISSVCTNEDPSSYALPNLPASMVGIGRSQLLRRSAALTEQANAITRRECHRHKSPIVACVDTRIQVARALLQQVTPQRTWEAERALWTVQAQLQDCRHVGAYDRDSPAIERERRRAHCKDRIVGKLSTSDGILVTSSRVFPQPSRCCGHVTHNTCSSVLRRANG